MICEHWRASTHPHGGICLSGKHGGKPAHAVCRICRPGVEFGKPLPGEKVTGTDCSGCGGVSGTDLRSNPKAMELFLAESHV